MKTKEIINLLRPKGDYSKTDMQNYSELSSGKIKVALSQKTPEHYIPILNMLEDKDTSIGCEIEKRCSSIENKFFSHDIDAKYDESIEEIIKASIHAKLFGISVIELYINEVNELAFTFIPREYYYFEEGLVYLKSGKNKFIPNEPKYYTIKHKPVLLKTLWIGYAKHFVLSHYLKFTEFLGVPPLIGNASSSDETVITHIAEAFKNLRSGSYGVFGKDDVVKVLEGRGSQADFMEFVKYCDTEIAKVINGASLGSNTATTGSYAQSKSHEENRTEITKGDIKLAQRLAAILFAKINIPLVLNIQIEKDVDLKARAETLKALSELGFSMSVEEASKEFDLPLIHGAIDLNTNSMGLQRLQDMGVKLSINNIIEMFKLTLPENEADTLKIPEKKEISQNNRTLSFNTKPLPNDTVDAILEDDSFNEELRDGEEELLKEIQNIAAYCNSYEEVYDKLILNYKNIEFKKLDELMFKAIATNLLIGAIDGGK
jgi:hypothetical protein